MAKTDTTDAITLLKDDHRKVEALFEKFENAEGAEAKQTLATEICTELSIHAMIEEEYFYPAVKEVTEDEAKLDEAYVEHDGAKVLIAELVAGAPDDAFYDAKMKVLSEEIRHHVKEEEKPGDGIFAQARGSELDLDALGEQLRDRKKELLAKFKSGGLPPPITRTFTGHELKQGSTVKAHLAA